MTINDLVPYPYDELEPIGNPSACPVYTPGMFALFDSPLNWSLSSPFLFFFLGFLIHFVALLGHRCREFFLKLITDDSNSKITGLTGSVAIFFWAAKNKSERERQTSEHRQTKKKCYSWPTFFMVTFRMSERSPPPPCYTHHYPRLFLLWAFHELTMRTVSFYARVKKKKKC